MATGVPVIGSDSGAIPEVIGDAGIVFKEQNVRELANKVRDLHADRRLTQDLVVRGRLRAVARYSGPAVASATLEIYHRVLDSPT
jgi:glycosyltransferase involved in cell wall biosynthesis